MVALDLAQEQPISLSLRFQEIQDINSSSGSFTQNFRIPASPTNSNFFDHWEGAGETATVYNPKRKYEAWIVDDGMPILQGALQLLSIVKQHGRPTFYEVVVVGNTGGLASAVQNLQLADLDFSGAYHKHTQAEITALLNNELAATTEIDSEYDGELCYSLFAKDPQWESYFANPLYSHRLVPFLKIRKIIDAIFAESGGYTYQSDFFGTGEGGNVWMPVYNGADQVSTVAYTPAEFKVQLNGSPFAIPSYSITIGPSTFVVPAEDGIVCSSAGNVVLEWSETGTLNDLGDPNGVFTPGTDKFTAPETRMYQFKTMLECTNRSPLYSGVLTFFLMQNTTTLATDTVYLQSGGVDEEPPTVIKYHTWDVFLTAGDEVHFEMAWSGLHDDKVGVTENSSWRQTDYNVSSPYQNYVDLANSMPNMSCLDFLRGLQRTFNLVFVPDESRKLFTIEPASDYLQTGTMLDWSQKVDTSKDIVVKPTTDLQSRIYEFNHAEASDLLNEAFTATANRIAGRMKIEDTDNDWASGTNEIESPFAPFIAVDNSMGFAGFVAYDADGEPLDDHPPMLCYLAQTSRPYAWRVGFESTTVQQTDYLFFSPFSSAPAQNTDKALLFGPDTFMAEDTQPENTLFNYYWGDYFQSLYYQESKILECYMYLTRTDVNQLDWRDTISLKEGVFRVLSIDNYTANSEETCRVTLLQTAGDVRLCEFTQPSVNNGVVTFTDANGATGLTGSRRCCLYYGYTWTGSTCTSPFFNLQDPPTNVDVEEIADSIGNLDPTAPVTGRIDAVETTTTNLAADLATETAARAAADNALNTKAEEIELLNLFLQK